MAAREQRRLSRETVVQEAHIPAYYLQMLEDEDYRLISDQLYLLPFLRRYATFLDIDPDETVMRLLHEVQRVDNGPAQVRLDEPLDNIRRYRRRNWSKPIMFGGLIAVIIGAYIAQSRHKDTDTIPASTVQPPQAAIASPSASASKAALNSFPATQSTSTAAANRPYANTVQQPASGGTTASAPGAVQTMNPAMMMPVVGPDQPSSLHRGSTSGAHPAPTR